MSDEIAVGTHERWAHLRFSVVGPLLASPPSQGQLQAQLTRLADTEWRHPVTGKPVRYVKPKKAHCGSAPVLACWTSWMRRAGNLPTTNLSMKRF